MYENITYQLKNSGKKAEVKGKSGDHYIRSLDQWGTLERTVDRVRDTYDEVVRDSDGNIIHECHEPLSKHLGHGDDRKGKQG